ncbi:MAG TPA: sigma 54-interacting transcriptional regulator [Terriglobia bacterium]|nr:sigma 54-interacting transcriptional regulator [Terriglobia bacterium]
MPSRELDPGRPAGAVQHQAEVSTPDPKLFQELFELSPDALVATGPQGQIVEVNGQFERIFGYRRSEVLGQNIALLVPERFRAAHAVHLRDYFTEPRLRPMGAGLELFGRRKDGSEFPVDIMLNTLRLGPAALVLAVIRDISVRKQLEVERDRQAAISREQAALLEVAHDAIIVRDLESRITFWNHGAEVRYGWSREEALGKVTHSFLQTQFPDTLEEIEGRLHNQGYWEGELVHTTRYGRRITVASRQVLQRDPEGRSAAILEINNDITERKQAQEALRRNEERLRSLVESVKDYAIVTLDAEGRVTSWNPGAERIVGYKAEEIIGQHFSKFYPQEDLDRGKPDYELRVAAAAGRFEDEGWRLRQDGSRFWANVVISALHDSDGRVSGFSKVTRDFTERKQAEEALLLQVTNTLVTNLEIGRLLAAIAASIRQVASFDYSGLALFDSSTGQLHIHVLEAPGGRKLPPDGTPISLSGSPAGQAFTSREPLVLNHVRQEAEGFAAGDIKRLTDLSVNSGCWVPLINRGRPLGTLMVGKIAEGAFTEKDVRLLSHVASQIAIAIDNAETYRQVIEARERLEEEKAYLEEELRTEYNFEEIVGESHALRRVLKQVETVAPTDATVLVLGETGTGKELVARAIHSLSGRRDRTFVKLNCAAIPSGLLESELFGHEKGAFTGAITQKIGRLELAHRGTLFLDEVGDIPLELQPKLLRALQEKEFERLGSTRTIPVDVRLIAATNRDLAAMVQTREFRSDLFYRLKVFPIEVPPLRMRTDDIPILVHHFVSKHARRMNKVIETIPQDTMRTLERWSWPGNVRELENLLERAVILSSGPVLRVPISELVPSQQEEPETPPETASSSLEATEREHILRVLRETEGVISGPDGAAARLGLKRTTLNSKMRKLGITRHDF